MYFIKCSECPGKTKKKKTAMNGRSPDRAYKTWLWTFRDTYVKVLHVGFAYSFHMRYDQEKWDFSKTLLQLILGTYWLQWSRNPKKDHIFVRSHPECTTGLNRGGKVTR